MHVIEVNKQPYLYLNQKEFKTLLKSGVVWNSREKQFFGVCLTITDELDFIISRDEERDLKGIAIKRNNVIKTFDLGEVVNNGK